MTRLSGIISFAGHFLTKHHIFFSEKTDHKILTRYLSTLSQRQSPQEMVRQSADCLKEITKYKMFAFAIKTQETTRIWSDPKLGDAKLARMIKKEFHVSDDKNFVFHHIDPKGQGTPDPCSDKLVSYTICNNEFYARIYLIPDRHMQAHHDEVAQMVLKSTAAAVATQLKLKILSSAATQDPLTGCYNRRELEQRIKGHINHARRYNSDLSLFIFDLDHFKKVNDHFGHPAGDHVLKSIAGLVRQNMRGADSLFRFGGEEFIGLLPGADKTKAIEMATRLCHKIAAHSMHYNGITLRVSASFGVARFDALKMDEASFIKAADAMLYRAKFNGRNQVMPGLLKMLPPDEADPASASCIHVI